jgi:hypothetical protein
VDGTVPGDRASACGGLLVPVGAERVGSSFDLLYRCSACGAARKNRVIEQGPQADDQAALRRLVARLA